MRRFLLALIAVAGILATASDSQAGRLRDRMQARRSGACGSSAAASICGSVAAVAGCGSAATYTAVPVGPPKTVVVNGFTYTLVDASPAK